MSKKKVEKPVVKTVSTIDLLGVLKYLQQEQPELGSQEPFWPFLIDTYGLGNDTSIHLDPWWLAEIADSENIKWATALCGFCEAENIGHDVLWTVCW